MKKVWIILVVLIAAAVGGWFLWQWFQATRQATTLLGLQTVPAERGDLTATVGATGVVRVNQSVLLSWQTSGIVAQVYTSLGDKVVAKTVLAELAPDSLPQTLLQAQAELINAQKALDELLKPATEVALAQAEQAIATAKDAVRDAEQYLANLQAPAPQVDIDQAKANLVLAAHKLSKAQEAYQPYANKPENNLMRATLLSKLAQAQKEYDAAVRRLNNLLGKPNPIDLEIAKANVDLAKAQLQDAEEKYQQLKEGAKAEDIAAAEARVAAAQAVVDQAKIIAPFDGVITEVDVNSGDKVSPGAVAFRLDDLSRLLVDARISEVDINNVRPGQEVTLAFDAILGAEYHGVITQVSIVGSTAQGVVEFSVTIEIGDADERIKPGMTAAVNIVVDRLEDVLIVPNRAVRVKEGKRVVYVLRNNVPQPVEISLGASSETMSQVLTGDLKEGDLIILNPPVEFEQGGPPSFIR